jgi:hypothetical protein
VNVSRWAVVIIGCLLFFGVGFVAGGFVEAGALSPGSAGDPLAAKSYVEKAVGEKTSKLQAQVDALQARILNLQKTVEKLKTEINPGTVAGVNPPALEVEKQPSVEVKKPIVEEEVAPITSNEEITSDAIPTGKSATVIAASVNVRKGPGATYPKVSGLLKGKSVSVLIIQNGWVYVDLGANVKGWVSKDLVEIK